MSALTAKVEKKKSNIQNLEKQLRLAKICKETGKQVPSSFEVGRNESTLDILNKA